LPGTLASEGAISRSTSNSLQFQDKLLQGIKMIGELFHVGELARYKYGVVPLVVLIESQAMGLLWQVLFPDGVVYQVGTDQLEKL